MKIGKFKLSKRAVSPVIATLLMIAIAVAASIIVYVWSIGLLGGLMSSGGGAQTSEQLILEAYDGDKGLTVRNVGTRSITLVALYVDGKPDTAISSTTTLTVDPATSKPFSLTAAPPSGLSHNVKLVSQDGAVFVFTIVGGQAS
jgi:flagellin-like protein